MHLRRFSHPTASPATPLLQQRMAHTHRRRSAPRIRPGNDRRRLLQRERPPRPLSRARAESPTSLPARPRRHASPILRRDPLGRTLSRCLPVRHRLDHRLNPPASSVITTNDGSPNRLQSSTGETLLTLAAKSDIIVPCVTTTASSVSAPTTRSIAPENLANA